jgi:hypothetical protein
MQLMAKAPDLIKRGKGHQKHQSMALVQGRKME